MPSPFTRSGAGSRRAALSASFTYALLLAGPGVYLPFFPLWLSQRGLDGTAIGFVLALPMLMRVFAAAPFARIGDGPLGARRTFLIMVCGSALGYAGLSFTHDLWSIALMIVVMSAFIAPTIPLLDVIVLDGVARHGHDYGRIRQWGSVAWLASSIGAGVFFTTLPIEALPPLLAALAALTVFAGLWLPDDRSKTREHYTAPNEGLSPDRVLLSLFCAGVACLQGAHAFLYSFGTLIFQSNGFGSVEIGMLWAIGVVLETTLFIFAGNLAGQLGPYRMIGIGAIAGITRWLLLGLDPHSGLVLALLQAMHGLSFAAVHLGTMVWLSRFGRGRAARQGLVASAIGGGLALGSFVAGPLYEYLGTHGYWVMAGVAALGSAFIVAARLRERGMPYPQRAGAGG